MDARNGKAKKPNADDRTDGDSHNLLKTGTQTAWIKATAMATRPRHTLGRQLNSDVQHGETRPRVGC